jgi:hypothetical protein
MTTNLFDQSVAALSVVLLWYMWDGPLTTMSLGPPVETVWS